MNYKKDKVRIVIIDSGISSELEVKGSLVQSINLQGTGNVEDGHGHGTALVGMLDEFCGNSLDLVMIKILDDHCRCTTDDLLKAMDLAIEIRPDIINLSLGTEDMSRSGDFEKRSDLARSKDILMVTTTNGRYNCLPYLLDNSIKVVTNSKILNDDYLYVNKHSVFLTLGTYHIVPWKSGKYVFMDRNSFSTPYFIREFVKSKVDNQQLSNYELLLDIRKRCRDIDNLQVTGRILDIPEHPQIYQNIKRAVEVMIDNFDESKSTFEQGLSMEGCIDLLYQLKRELTSDMPFTFFNIYDFEFISNLTNKIGKLMT